MFFAPQRTITLWARGHHWLKTGGVFLAKKEYTRPDEKTMYRLLEANRGKTAGLILSLAWNMGLYREEMYQLKWDDISLEEGVLHLPDRSVPIDAETDLHLREFGERHRGHWEYVLISDRRKTRMSPGTISVCARTALDEAGMTDIRLRNLRRDFVIRQLEQHDWSYVVRVSGITVDAIYLSYREYMVNEAKDKTGEERPRPEVDELKLRKIIQSDTSPAGLALWMCWKLRLTGTEVVSLTWDQIDMEKENIVLKNRSVPIDDKDLMIRLIQLKEERPREADPHVLLRPRTGTPYERGNLSRAVRTLLIRGGMEGTTFDDLIQKGRPYNYNYEAWSDSYVARKELELPQIMNYATKNGSITRNEVMELLKISKVQAVARLRKLREAEKLVKVGDRYYPAGEVVPPEEHYEAICAYLETEVCAYCQEIADLLHISNIQAQRILRNLVNEGKLDLKKQVYLLPKGGKK